MKEMMVHYILQPHHVFIRVKVFILMLVLGRLQLLIISTCFACRPVTSINKSHVLTASAHENCYINIQLLISCDMGIYAIMGFQTQDPSIQIMTSNNFREHLIF